MPIELPARNSSPPPERRWRDPYSRPDEPEPDGLLAYWHLELKKWSERHRDYWPFYVPVALYFLYSFIRHWAAADRLVNRVPAYADWFWGINLGVHELGHIIMAPFGKTLMLLGGSFWQCAFPVIVMLGFLRQRQFLGVAFTFGWLGSNFFSVATYMSDARAMRLYLVSPFGPHPLHDWNTLLRSFGMLEWNGVLALLMRLLASGAYLASLGLSAYVMYRMIAAPRGDARPGLTVK